MGEIIIENVSEANTTINGDTNLINTLVVELNRVRAMNEQTLRRTDDLRKKVGLCEVRLEQVHLARGEGEKIAQGINDLAESRVQRIVENAHRIVGPLHEQISTLEKEIAILSQEIAPPEKSDNKAVIKEEPVPTAYEVRREYSLREPQAMEAKQVVLQPEPVELTEPEPAPLVKREYSLREPQSDSQEGAGAGNIEAEVPPAELQPVIKRGYSLREPQALDLAEEKMEAEGPSNIEAEIPPPEIQTVVKREYSLREPQDLLLPEEKLEIAKPEAGEPDMRFDVFVDNRHFETVAGVGEPIHNHSWQVRVDVEIPPNNPENVYYGKVYSAITCTLNRYDNVLLNEAFPFTLLEPSAPNIAKYFYNCLEDNLSLMGVMLKEMTLWENPSEKIAINYRSSELDALLNHGEDILEEIRDRLNSQPKGLPTATFRDRVGRVLSL